MNESLLHLEDQILVMDAQDGDSEAMDRLFRRWQRRLWEHARRLTGDPDAAWDVSQQSWLAIIKGLQRLNDPACFHRWAMQIVRHKAINWIKRRKCHFSLDDNYICDYLDKTVLSVEVLEVLERLDVSRRTILVLYYFERFSISQISTLLRIPSGTVKSRLHIARQAFRTLWNVSQQPTSQET